MIRIITLFVLFGGGELTFGGNTRGKFNSVGRTSGGISALENRESKVCEGKIFENRGKCPPRKKGKLVQKKLSGKIWGKITLNGGNIGGNIKSF